MDLTIKCSRSFDFKGQMTVGGGGDDKSDMDE